MDEVKVISITSKPGFTFKRTTNYDQKICRHPNVVVDEENRVIECEKCGIVLDAFEYLKSVCYSESSAFERYTLLLKENAKLERQYKTLTKKIDEAKLKLLK